MYGGHISADPDVAKASPTDVTAHLYFFMVKNRRTADKERLVFWFNVRRIYFDFSRANFIAQGGPGCSSFDGAMMEVGPWRWDTKTDHDFFVKEGGWEEYTTVVFSACPSALSRRFAANVYPQSTNPPELDSPTLARTNMFIP